MEKEAEEKAVMELKQELQRVNILIGRSLEADESYDEDNCVNTAIDTIGALKELKEIGSDGGLKKLRNLGLEPPSPEYICPISRLVMEDPVVGNNGLSYERRCIEKWVKDGNGKWPGSEEEVGDSVFLIPNFMLKNLILQWCHGPFEAKEEEKQEEKYVYEFDQREFLCPICDGVMESPVVAASGQTFDRPCIAKWLKERNRKCPKTDEPLSHTLLIPNRLLEAIIHKTQTSFEQDHGIAGDGDERDEHPIEPANRDHLINSLVQLPSLSTPSKLLPKLKDLRLLTARLPSFRSLFAKLDGAASRLLNPFLIKVYKSDPSLSNEVVATVMNISVEESNKPKIVQDCPSLLPFLFEALKPTNRIETRGFAAAALGQLSSHEPNCLVIGGSAIFELLIKLMEVGHSMASREAAIAVWRLCSRSENWKNLILVGGHFLLVDKLEDPGLVDVILEILALISSYRMVVDAVLEPKALHQLFRIMAETKSRREQEKCVDLIYEAGRMKIREVEEVENGVRTLYQLSNEGSESARRKVNRLISMIKGKGKAPMFR